MARNFRQKYRIIFYAAAMLTMVPWILFSKYFGANLVNLFLLIPAVSILIAFFIPPRPVQMVIPTVVLHILNVYSSNLRDSWGEYYGSDRWPWMLATIIVNVAVVGTVSWRMRTLVVDAKALWWGRVLRTIGGILFTLGLLTIVVFRFVPEEGAQYVSLAGVTILVFGYAIGYRGRQYDAIARKDRLEKDGRRCVLYLRSFRRDENILWSSLRHLLNFQFWPSAGASENQLADAVAPIGPLIAVGKPGERLPQPGAHRVYIPDEEWKSRVVRMMKKAQLVIVRVEIRGEGLWWEIEQAAKTAAPGRLLLLMLLSKREYWRAQEHIQKISGLKLPALKNTRVFLWFKEGSIPVLLKLKAPFWRTPFPQEFGAKTRCALRPVFNSLRCEWTPPRISATRIILTVFVVIGLLFLLVAFLIALVDTFWPRTVPYWLYD